MTGYPAGTPVLNMVTVAQNPNTVQSSDGSVQTLTGGHQGEIFARELGGKRYTAASRGNLYWGSTGAIALGLYTSTAATCLLYNPGGTGKLIEVHKIRVTATASATDLVDGFAIGYSVNVGSGIAVPSSITGGTVLNMPLGGTSFAPLARFANSATIVAPTLLAGLGVFTASTTSTQNQGAPVELDLDGTLVLAPGSLITVGVITTIEGSANQIVDITWSEWLP